MAENMVSTFVDPGFVNIKRAKAKSAIGSSTELANAIHYTSVQALDDRLTAINAAYYTQSMLMKMTLNDKVYAVRMNDDPDTIK